MTRAPYQLPCKYLKPDDYRAVVKFIGSHPGMLYGTNANGTPIIRIECWHADENQRWVEYVTVWTMDGARAELGY